MAITETASIYLNANDPDQTLFFSPSNSVLARSMAGSSSDVVQLSVFWVTTTGASPTYDIPGATDTVILSAKKRPSDATLIYEVTEWTRVTDAPAHYLGTLDLGVASDFWDNDTQTEKTITAQIIVRNAGNTERKTWIFPLRVKRGTFGSETPPDTLVPYLDEVAARGIFVAYDEARSLTPANKSQVVENVTLGRASITTATTITQEAYAVITITEPLDSATAYNADARGLVVGMEVVDGDFPLGTTIVSIDDPGSSSTTIVFSQSINTLGTTTIRATISISVSGGSTPSYAGITIPFTASRGGVRLGTSATDGRSMEWLDSSGAVAAYADLDGNLFLVGNINVGGNLNVDGDIAGTFAGNAATASALLTARTIFGQSFDGTGNVTGTVTSATIQTDSSGGGTLKSNNGTTCLTWGSGGGGNLTLVSPALGTPASGNLANCTPGTTSAAGVLQLATNAQAQTGTSTAIAVTPAALAARLMDPCFIPLSVSVMRSFTSGTGYALDSSKLAATTFTSTAGVGYSIAAVGYPGLEGIGQPGQDRLLINFSKKIEISGVWTGWTGYAGDANSTARLMLGGKVTVAGGAASSRSIGFTMLGGGGNVFLAVHNGTSLTTVDTGFAQTLNTPWSFRLISDGAGNVSLSINGATAVTSSAGPTGNSASGACFLTMVEGVSGNATKFLGSLCHGWLYCAP